MWRVAVCVLVVCSVVGAQYTVPEQQPPLTIVGDVAANLTLNSSLLAGLRFSKLSTGNPDAAHFTVDAVSGVVRTAGVIDRERVGCAGRARCVLRLDVAAHSPPGYFRLFKLDIVVEDINDNSPAFPEPRVTQRIPENTAPGSSFPLPRAHDADSPQYGVTLYRLVTHQPAFSLRTTDDGGVSLVLESAVDRESRRSYSLVIAAVDGGSPARTGSLAVDVVISDVNDNPPRFTNTTYRGTVREDAAPDAPLLAVHAVDLDEGEHAQVIYTLTAASSTDVGDVIAVDNRTGELRLRRRVDYEARAVYELGVLAVDAAGVWLPAAATVIITVIDVNDNAPYVSVEPVTSSGRMEIPEHSPPGSYLAVISVTDPESPPDLVQCVLRGAAFRTEPLSSQAFKLVTAGDLDREQQAQYELEFVCSDGGAPPMTSTTVVMVTVSDVNDQTPVFTAPTYAGFVRENQPRDTHVVTVSATDDDVGVNAALRYSLVGGEEAGLDIDAVSGVVSTTRPLDREQAANYTLLVTARDLGSRPRTATAAVLVTVEDENDEPPAFTADHYEFTVDELAEVGTPVGRVIVTDPDVVLNHHVVISDQQDVFHVDAVSGQLTTRRLLDDVAYTLTLRAVDDDDPTQYSACVVDVIVRDVNDHAPNITFPPSVNYTLVVPDYDDVDRVVTRLEASDADAGVNARLTYHLLGDHLASTYFSLDPTSGEVRVRRALPAGRTMTLDVVVSDGGSPPRSVRTQFNVVIEARPNDRNLIVLISVAVASSLLIIVLIVAIVVVVRKDEPRKHDKRRLQKMFADNSLLVNTGKTTPHEVSFSNDVCLDIDKMYMEKSRSTNGNSRPGSHGDADSGRGSNEDGDWSRSSSSVNNNSPVGTTSSHHVTWAADDVNSRHNASSERRHHVVQNERRIQSRDTPDVPPALPPKDTPSALAKTTPTSNNSVHGNNSKQQLQPRHVTRRHENEAAVDDNRRYSGSFV